MRFMRSMETWSVLLAFQLRIRLYLLCRYDITDTFSYYYKRMPEPFKTKHAQSGINSVLSRNELAQFVNSTVSLSPSLSDSELDWLLAISKFEQLLASQGCCTVARSRITYVGVMFL